MSSRITSGSSSIASTTLPPPGRASRAPGSPTAAAAAGASAGAQGSGAAQRNGIVSVNVEPPPGVLSSVMSPPRSCASRRLIDRPSPVPPYCRVLLLSTWRNSSNTSSSWSAGMPMPVSATATATASPLRRAVSVIVPASVNLAALLRD